MRMRERGLFTSSIHEFQGERRMIKWRGGERRGGRTVSPKLTRRFFNVSLCWILYRPCFVTLVISRTSENCGPQEQNKLEPQVVHPVIHIVKCASSQGTGCVVFSFCYSSVVAPGRLGLCPGTSAQQHTNNSDWVSAPFPDKHVDQECTRAQLFYY